MNRLLDRILVEGFDSNYSVDTLDAETHYAKSRIKNALVDLRALGMIEIVDSPTGKATILTDRGIRTFKNLTSDAVRA